MFDPAAYGETVARILASPDPLSILKSQTAQDLFPHARSPLGALAGLYLRCGAWHEAHQIAQDLDTREGSYWHALIHRAEPDEWNANYWFRRVGDDHPVRQAARRDPSREWELLFDYCAREKGESA